MTSEIPTVMITTNTVFRDVTPFSLAEIYRFSVRLHGVI